MRGEGVENLGNDQALFHEDSLRPPGREATGKGFLPYVKQGGSSIRPAEPPWKGGELLTAEGQARVTLGAAREEEVERAVLVQGDVTDELDVLIREVKAAKKKVGEAEESEAKPLYDQWKAAKARYAPTITDLDRLAKGLVNIVDGFKRKLAAEKAEAERKAAMEAAAARRAAEEAAKQADVANIEAQREALAKLAEADAAQAALKAAKADTVKGMRTVWRHEITDHKALLHWIAVNDKPAMTRFIEEYARAHHKQRPMDGVRTWSTKEAF
jgi:hypothetical protein